MAAGITTSIRMPAEVRDLYETPARATGRAKNETTIEVLRIERQRRVDEIAMVSRAAIRPRPGGCRRSRMWSFGSEPKACPQPSSILSTDEIHGRRRET